MKDTAAISSRQKILDYFNVREGEVEPTLLLTLQLMLGIASVICLKAVSDSIFLTRFPAQRLPYVDLTVTALVGFVVGLYIRLSNRWSLPRLVGFTQVFLSGNLLLFWFLLREHVTGAPALLYVWVGIFAVLIPSQVWSMAGMVFDTRQAKRLFALIGSGGIMGAALGGEVASIIGPIIGTENVLPATATFVLACAAIVYRLSFFRAVTPAGGDLGGAVRASFRDTFQRVVKNRYLSLITLSLFLSTIASTIIKYQFKALAQFHYGENQSALTAFFGDFYGYIAVVSFLFHMVATGRLLRWAGLGLTLFILPSAMLLGAIALLLSISLGTGIAARGADQAFRHSLDRASIELLYVPLPPHIRARIKSFVDMIVARSADGLANITVLVLLSWPKLGIAGISWVNLGFIGLWMVAVWQLGREYVHTLRSSIERKDISAEQLLRQLAGSASEPALELTLQSSDQRAIETAIDWMQYGGAAGGQAQLAALLTHESGAIRQKTMMVIATNAIPGCAKEVLRFLELEHDVEARWQGLGYLEQQDGAKAHSALGSLLQSPDRDLAATAAARLLHQPETAGGKAAEVFHAYIDWAESQGPESRSTAARLIGLAPPMPELSSRLARFLRDEDPNVVRAALQSAATLKLWSEVPTMLAMLTDRRLRREARHSLAAYGEPLLEALRDTLQDASLGPDLRRQIPRVISGIGGPRSAQLLLDTLRRVDGVVGVQVIRALVRIRRERPDLPFDSAATTQHVTEELRRYYREAILLESIPERASGTGGGFLRRALRERLDQRLDSVFQLLALIYPQREILDAHHWILSGRPDLRSNALEFLDSRLANPARELLLPALEDRRGGRIVIVARELLGVEEVPYASVLPRLLDSPDPWVRSCATYVVAEERRTDLRAKLKALAAEPDALLAETAALALRRLDQALRS
jgi:AAA family ATP:ADP antiporter